MQNKNIYCFRSQYKICRLSYKWTSCLSRNRGQTSEVLALTETWMTDDHSLVDLDIVSYQPIEFKARQNAIRRSGGVIFYVKIGLSFQVVSFKTDIECLIIKLTRENKNCTAYVQYIDQSLLNQQLHWQLRDFIVFSEGFSRRTIAFWWL